MADILMWFLLILGIIMVLNSYWLATAALAPARLEIFQSQYDHPLKTTLVGLLCVVPFVLAAAGCFHVKHPALNILGLACIGLPVVLGLAGSAGFARRLGSGLASDSDATQPWRRVLRGGIVFALTMLLPFIGWFFVLPWALVSGLGAMVLARRTPSR